MTHSTYWTLANAVLTLLIGAIGVYWWLSATGKIREETPMTPERELLLKSLARARTWTVSDAVEHNALFQLDDLERLGLVRRVPIVRPLAARNEMGWELTAAGHAIFATKRTDPQM